MIGKTVLHYKILEKLGEGGMGIVYLAEDTKLERKVAIKFLPRHISENMENRQRFKIEAKAAAKLNHPNIAIIHSIEEADEQMFIVMEYIKGKELKDLIKTGHPSEPEQPKSSLKFDDIINYAVQIAEGLNAAHKEGIIHRDIKPRNIMITTDGKVKIMDFGLAKVGGRYKLTKIGSTIGTIDYMSPEQTRGEKINQQTDIWSFGVVLFEMFTGKLPFNAEYDQAVIYSILNEDPKLTAGLDSSLPPGIEKIILKALAKDKSERYQKTEDILTDLTTEQKNLEFSKSGFNERSNISKDDEGLIIKNTNWLFKFVLPSTVFALSVILFLIFNPFKSKVFKASSNTSTNVSLAVMYFENIPNPEDKKHTGDMITNLLITDLSQSKEMEVISRDQLYRILDDIGLSDNKIITRKTAIKVAQNAGISTILVGSILQDAPSLAVTTRLIDVNTGKILGSQRLVGYKSEQIFPFVDSLALLVKNDLQVTQSDNSGIKSVAEVTTNSPEAYRAYAEGLNLKNKIYGTEAAAAFKKAIELDSTFAMAYYYLSSLQEDPVEIRKTLHRAVEMADNATEKEKLLIFGRNFFLRNKRTQAAEVYKQIIEKYPHEIEAYENLASIQPQDLNIDLLLRGVHNNPSAKILWNDLAISYTLNNQKQNAIDAVNEYIKLSPAEPNPYDTKGWIYAMFMEYDSSAVYFKKVLDFRKDFLRSAMMLGFYAAFKNKYKEAQKYFNMSGISPLRYPSIDIHRGLLNSEIKRLTKSLNSNITYAEKTISTVILIHLLYETGQFKKMLRIPAEGISKWEKIYPNGTYGRQWLAWALTKNGKSKEAENIIENMLKNADKSFPNVLVVGLFASATISFEKSEYETAIEKFNEAFSKLKPNHESNIFYAICLLKTGRIQEALVQFKRIKNWPMSLFTYQQSFVPGGRFYGYIYNVKAHYWLGVAYEKNGEKEKAIKEYKTFLDTWKNADFDSPELKNAHIRVAELEAD